MAWKSSIYWPFEVAFSICLIFGSLNLVLSQDQSPACLLLDTRVNAKDSGYAFESIAIRVTEGEPQVAVLVDFNRQLPFTQFTLQAWDMFNTITGSWYPPDDTNFQVTSCSLGVDDTVIFAPNQQPELGTNRFTWLSPDTAANETTIFFRVRALLYDFPTVDYSSGTITLDLRPPDIVNCPTESIIVTVPIQAGDTYVVTWQPIHAVDNLGTPNLLSASNQPGDAFPVDRNTTVTYVFADGVGHTSTCSFHVIVMRNTGTCIQTNDGFSCICVDGSLCGIVVGTKCSCYIDSSGKMIGCEVSAECDASSVLEGLAEIPVDERNVLLVSTVLKNVTSKLIIDKLEGDELPLIATVLENIGNVNNSIPKVTGNVIETINNVLYLPNDVFEAGGDSPGRILRSFETQLTYVRENLTMDNLSNLGVDVVVLPRNVQTDQASGLSFAIISPDGVLDDTFQNDEVKFGFGTEPQDDAEAFIGIPDEALDLAAKQDPSANMTVVFTAYLTSKLFQPASPKSLSFPDGRNLLVNSRIISAIIGDQNANIQNLINPVVTSFMPFNQSLTADQVCVFWDFAASNWSTKGCTRSTVNSSQSNVACDCNHLTNFAILLSYYGDIKSDVLDIISKVGCGISMAALVLTILPCLVLSELRNKPAKKSLINLCVSLLAMYAVFLAGIDQAQSPVTCIIMGALIHYFFLTSVCWASAEALNLFYLLVQTRIGLMTKYLLMLMLFCWGVPVIIVAITYLVMYLGSGQLRFEHDYCFLPPSIALYIGVLLPVGLLLLFNVFIFILLVRRIVCQRIESSQTRSETRTGAAIRHGQVMLPMSLLIGATWLVGFLAVEGATYVFQWIFAILNSLLGLAIFLLFIVGRKRGRKGLRKLLCVDKIRKITSTNTSSNQMNRDNLPRGVGTSS